MRAQAEHLIHKAAWLYYVRGLRQEAIAEALGVSRGSVVNYLKRARETGAVSIRMSTGAFQADVMARELEERFALDSVWIISEGAEFNLGAGAVLLDMIQPGGQIALGWGQTLFDIIENLPISEFDDISILQMSGNLGAPFPYRGERCALELARRLRAAGENLFAPLVLCDAELAGRLRREKSVADHLAKLAHSDLAIFSIGACRADTHVVACGAMTEAELAQVIAAGAGGFLAGRLFDGAGREMECDYNRRLIAIDVEALRNIPRRLCFVHSEENVAALATAISGGLVSHLVVSESVAKALMAQKPT